MKRLLVMEGNTRARQRVAESLGARSAAAIYKEAIQANFPDIETDIVQGAEGLAGMPTGSALDDYDGLVIGGSGLRCADSSPEVILQIEFLRQFATSGRPILGSCWGLQIAVVAAGGSVRPSPNGREIVVARKLRLTAAGQAHAFYAGKPAVFDAPCTHYDEIESLPSGSTLLCSNTHSEVQGALVPVEQSVVWGVQYHPEYDIQHLADLLRLYGDEPIKDGFFENEAGKLEYIEKLDRLANHPSDKSLAWQLGIDDDLLKRETRNAEIINWIRSQILID